MRAKILLSLQLELVLHFSTPSNLFRSKTETTKSKKWADVDNLDDAFQVGEKKEKAEDTVSQTF